ncbi:hypothetical protein Cgig2_028646 [Carnegiea gigantea]|uniref:Replication protein A OB domain-containing protein n=1 Tax=Carnegiea gigantea TaxID=171969 RepID=A0A9Q1JXK7_9CARY|nr:hypothetical protein Cgig2_028646 [Carnegiea gigantea]
MAHPIKNLRELDETTIFYKVKVKVIEKCHRRIAKNGTRYQRLKFVDNEKTEIQTTLFNDSIEDYQDHLCYGKEYYISNAKVKKTGERYETLLHDYHLEFDHRMIIEPIEENTNPKPLTCRSLDQIPKHVDREERFDILAAVIHIDQIKTITIKHSDRQCQLREVRLINQSWKRVLLSVWNEVALEECKRMASMTTSTQSTVIIVAAITLSYYEGLSLSTTPSSTVIFDIGTPQADPLRSWFVVHFDANDETGEISLVPFRSTAEKLLNRKPAELYHLLPDIQWNIRTRIQEQEMQLKY